MHGKKKRKKKSDPAWHPRQNAAPRDLNSFSTENLLRFMRTASSPAKSAVVLNSTKTPVCDGEKVLSTPTGKHASKLLSPSGYTLSTPEAGPKTSHLITPKGSKLFPSRVIECDDGFISVFLSENKVISKELDIPLKPKPWIQHSPIPKADMNGMIDIPITKKQLKKVEAQSRKRRKAGEDPRGISQNKLNKIPATKAMRNAGVEVENGDGHYVHFIPFSFLGDDAQKVNNMGIGTRFSNAAMELVNPAIRRLLYMKNGPKVVYLSAIPEWVPGFEKIRLLKSITYIIKDGKGNDFQHSARVTFNTLSLSEVCLTDVRPIRDSIIQKFSGKTPKPITQSPISRPAPLSPSFRLLSNVAPKPITQGPKTKPEPLSPSMCFLSKVPSSLNPLMSPTLGSFSNQASPILPAYRKSLSKTGTRMSLFSNKENDTQVRKLVFPKL